MNLGHFQCYTLFILNSLWWEDHELDEEFSFIHIHVTQAPQEDATVSLNLKGDMKAGDCLGRGWGRVNGEGDRRLWGVNVIKEHCVHMWDVTIQLILYNWYVLVKNEKCRFFRPGGSFMVTIVTCVTVTWDVDNRDCQPPRGQHSGGSAERIKFIQGLAVLRNWEAAASQAHFGVSGSKGLS